MRLKRLTVFLAVIAGLGLAQTLTVSALLWVPQFVELVRKLVDAILPGPESTFLAALVLTRMLFLAGLVVFPLAAGAAWAVHRGRERWLAAVGGVALLSPIGTLYLWPFSLVVGLMLLTELTRPDGRAAFGEPLAQAGREGRTSLERLALTLGTSAVLGLAWTMLLGVAVALTEQRHTDPAARGVLYAFAGANGLTAAAWLGGAVLCWLQRGRGVVLALMGASLVPCLTACSWLVVAPLAIWAIVVLRRPEVSALFSAARS